MSPGATGHTVAHETGIVGVVVFIAACIGAIVLYVQGGAGHPHLMSEGSSAGDGTTVGIDLEELKSDQSVLHINVVVSLWHVLLDPVTHNLKNDLNVVLTSEIATTRHTWFPGTTQVPE